MLLTQVIKRGLLPAAAVVIEKSKQEPTGACRPSELPIYTPRTEQEAPQKPAEPPGIIEDNVRTVRLTVTKVVDELMAYKRVGVEQFEKSKENVEWLVDYLQQEDNYLPKTGAVGIGALTGLIFGLRGGIIKKTLYATIGTLGMGAVCYPKEAAHYSEIGLVEGKKYLTIAYNFAYGVKKDDPPLELPSLPNVSGSVSEMWNSIKSTASSLISDKEKKVKEQVIDNPNTSTSPAES